METQNEHKQAGDGAPKKGEANEPGKLKPEITEDSSGSTAGQRRTPTSPTDEKKQPHYGDEPQERDPEPDPSGNP